MMTEHRDEVDAPPEVVWAVYADVESWPTWTASVRRLEGLDGPAVEVGRRFRISQPRLPTLVWSVTAVEPGRSWTWEQRSPGGRTIADHVVEPRPGGGSVVTQRLAQTGPIGALVGRLTRRLTVRYLAMEAAGLRAAGEARVGTAPNGGPTA